VVSETLGDISNVKDAGGGPQVPAQLRRLLLVPVTYNRRLKLLLLRTLNSVALSERSLSEAHNSTHLALYFLE
jgi:hypothetical protein